MTFYLFHVWRKIKNEMWKVRIAHTIDVFLCSMELSNAEMFAMKLNNRSFSIDYDLCEDLVRWQIEFDYLIPRRIQMTDDQNAAFRRFENMINVWWLAIFIWYGKVILLQSLLSFSIEWKCKLPIVHSLNKIACSRIPKNIRKSNILSILLLIISFFFTEKICINSSACDILIFLRLSASLTSSPCMWK